MGVISLVEKQEKAKEEVKQEGTKVGIVTHYFTNIGVAIIKLTDGNLAVGDTILVKGATSNFKQKIESMQMEHKNVNEAKKGQSIGLKVEEHAREQDVVYKV